MSAEHASHRAPAALAGLGLAPRWLRGHHGWDPGAAAVARVLARTFRAPLHLGQWSRLVVDLNRSAHHPRVVPPDLGAGRPGIPLNRHLDPAARATRIQRYWRPYRAAVEADLDAAVAAAGCVLHLSIHSFVERLGGQERRAQLGLLYHPRHPGERALADRLDARLTAAGFTVRRNWPYSGQDDGFCMRMRAGRDWNTYLGMEIEMNQRLARTAAGARRLAQALAAALKPEMGP